MDLLNLPFMVQFADLMFPLFEWSQALRSGMSQIKKKIDLKWLKKTKKTNTIRMDLIKPWIAMNRQQRAHSR